MTPDVFNSVPKCGRCGSNDLETEVPSSLDSAQSYRSRTQVVLHEQETFRADAPLNGAVLI